MATHVDWRPTMLGMELDRRQQGGANSTAPPPPTDTSAGNSTQGAPLSVFTFIIAIALFVLVVSFVLLRIFVRNRRLRRLGIYPDGPIERLLGGPHREYEDTLVPPKLWHAKIADVRANNASAQIRAEKGALGGNVGAGDVKEFGWDALMPVAAALPPNLYPIIYQRDNAQQSGAAQTQQVTGATTAQSQMGLLGRRMPNFLRRSTSEALEPAALPTSHAGNANAPNAQDTPDAASNNVTGPSHPADEASDETVSASVNVTVLIAMPSPKTVFPLAPRKPGLAQNPSMTSLRRSASKLNGSGILSQGGSRLAEVYEDVDTTAEPLPYKGKAPHRTPSLRSVKTTASAKSVAEARREAFFSQVAADSASDDGNGANPAGHNHAFDDDGEEEELPELVFGTASVPLFSKIENSGHGALNAAPTTLVSPTRTEILALLATAVDARTRAQEQAAAIKSASKNGEEADADADGAAANRRSLAGTSLEGGMSAAEEQNGLGDVVTRMMRSDGDRAANAEAYELGEYPRPALPSGPSSFARSAQLPAGADDPATSSVALTGAAARMGSSEQQSEPPTPLTAASERRPFFATSASSSAPVQNK